MSQEPEVLALLPRIEGAAEDAESLAKRYADLLAASRELHNWAGNREPDLSKYPVEVQQAIHIIRQAR